MSPDAIVVGAGPNGLSAAIVLARTGLAVQIIEAESTIGGGARSAELTLPGFIHDICSAIHPFGYCSPFFRQLPLAKHGLKWIYPPAAVAHLLANGDLAKIQNCRFGPTHPGVKRPRNSASALTF
ncbi:MAG: phytoene desaturase family protein [Terriglobales bacterium]